MHFFVTTRNKWRRRIHFIIIFFSAWETPCLFFCIYENILFHFPLSYCMCNAFKIIVISPYLDAYKLGENWVCLLCVWVFVCVCVYIFLVYGKYSLCVCVYRETWSKYLKCLLFSGLDGTHVRTSRSRNRDTGHSPIPLFVQIRFDHTIKTEATIKD